MDPMANIMPDVSVAPRLLISTTTFFVFAMTCFTARMYIRFRNFKMGLDDSFVIFAMLLLLFALGLLLGSIPYGIGRHIIYVHPDSVTKALRLCFFFSDLYIWAATLIKVSLAFTFLRIYQDKTWRVCLYVLIGLQVTVAAMSTITNYAECRPLRAFWDYTLSRDHCFDARDIQIWVYAMCSFTITTDCIYSILPIFVIVKLRRSIREKIALSALMGIGLLATAASAAKLHRIRQLDRSIDSTYLLSDLLMYSMLEVLIGMIAACLPCLKVQIERGLRMSTIFFHPPEKVKDVERGTQESGDSTTVRDSGCVPRVLRMAAQIPTPPPEEEEREKPEEEEEEEEEKGEAGQEERLDEEQIDDDMTLQGTDRFEEATVEALEIVRTTHIHVHTTGDSESSIEGKSWFIVQ